MTKNIGKFITCVLMGGGVTVLENLFGTYDKSLGFLCLVIVLDFITGLLCGWSEHELSSDVCTKGLFKKLFVFVYVIIGNHMDNMLNTDYIRAGICYMYATGEVLSIIENGVRLGVPIPTPIKKALEIINGGNEND